MYKIHKWLALPFGLVIFIIALTGAMLVFEPEINRLCNRHIYYVSETKPAPLPLSELMTNIDASLPDSVKAIGVTVYNDPERTYQVSVSTPPKNSVFINQYTGEITGSYLREGFFLGVFKLHRWLLDEPNPKENAILTGRTVVGTCSLLFMLALVTGAFIWWPRLKRKGVRKNLVIPFTDGSKAFLKGLHIAGGMYVIIILLCMGLTGPTWSFKWYGDGVNALFGVDKSARKEVVQHESIRIAEPDSIAHPYALWQEALTTLRTLTPDAPSITVNNGAASVEIGGYGNQRASNKYIFNARTGMLTPTILYSETTLSDNLRGWIYSIHTGSFGGLTTRILWFFAALIGATLPLTGYYIWVSHIIKRRRKKQG